MAPLDPRLACIPGRGPKTTNGVRNLATPCGATALQQEQCCSATKIKLTNSLQLLMGSHLPAGTAPCMECVIALIQIGVRRLPTWTYCKKTPAPTE